MTALTMPFHVYDCHFCNSWPFQPIFLRVLTTRWEDYEYSIKICKIWSEIEIMGRSGWCQMTLYTRNSSTRRCLSSNTPQTGELHDQNEILNDVVSSGQVEKEKSTRSLRNYRSDQDKRVGASATTNRNHSKRHLSLLKSAIVELDWSNRRP